MSDDNNLFFSEPTMMVVDDDAMVRSIIIEFLKKFGFQKIIEAKDGKQALQVVQNRKQALDVIISDWEMPHIDGLTLLRAVRNHPERRKVKFIMVTSQNSRERFKISQAVQLRVDSYIVKPFRGEVLKEKVFSVLKELFAERNSEAS